MAISDQFVTYFAESADHLLHEKGSKLLKTVDYMSAKGEMFTAEQIGGWTFSQVNARNQRINPQTIEHRRRVGFCTPYAAQVFIDGFDRERRLVELQSKYTERGVNDLGVKVDQEIIRALSGVAHEGHSGGTQVAWDTAYDVAHGSTGLTVAKLLAGKQMLFEANNDDSSKIYCLINPKAEVGLLSEAKATSGDYVHSKVLGSDGRMRSFAGVEFIITNQIVNDGSSDEILLFTDKAVAFNMQIPPTVSVKDNPEYIQSTQIDIDAMFGGVRKQEGTVVKILCQ